MAIFVTGLTGGAAEENDIAIKSINTADNLFGVFGGVGKIGTIDVTLNENITSVKSTFYDQRWTTGTVLFNCNPTNWDSCFYGVDKGYSSIGFTCNYTSICTNIDSIVNTAYKMTVKKGSLVVV